MVVSVLGDKCAYIYTQGGFFKILGFCFLVEDFYKPRNENIKILRVGVI